MQNEAQYDLGRKAAKISALSSNNLNKYEYLTGEDLHLKPLLSKLNLSILHWVKFLIKGSINIEDKNKERLKEIEDHEKKTIGCRFKIIKINQLF